MAKSAAAAKKSKPKGRRATRNYDGKGGLVGKAAAKADEAKKSRGNPGSVWKQISHAEFKALCDEAGESLTAVAKAWDTSKANIERWYGGSPPRESTQEELLKLKEGKVKTVKLSKSRGSKKAKAKKSKARKSASQRKGAVGDPKRRLDCAGLLMELAESEQDGSRQRALIRAARIVIDG